MIAITKILKEMPEFNTSLSDDRKSLIFRKYYKDPKYRKKISKVHKTRLKNPKVRKKLLSHLDSNRNTKRDPVTGRYIKQNVQAKEK